MKWLDEQVKLSFGAAWLTLVGMREVALVDGCASADLRLLDALEAELPLEARGATAVTIGSDERKDAYLRALLMVAIADGVITEREREVVERLAEEIGVPPSDVSRRIADVHAYFGSVTTGQQLLRIAALQLAEAVGLSDSTLSRLAVV